MPNFIRPGLGASDPDVERVGSHDASARARRREPLRRIDATALHAALPVYGLAAVFTVINAAARSQRWWAGIHGGAAAELGDCCSFSRVLGGLRCAVLGEGTAAGLPHLIFRWESYVGKTSPAFSFLHR